MMIFFAVSDIFLFFPLFMLIVTQFFSSFVWIKLEEMGEGNMFSMK